MHMGDRIQGRTGMVLAATEHNNNRGLGVQDYTTVQEKVRRAAIVSELDNTAPFLSCGSAYTTGEPRSSTEHLSLARWTQQYQQA